MTNKTKDIVKYGEVFSTPTGNNRKRNNLVLNIDGEGIEQVVGQYEEKLTPAKKIETAAERTRREERQRIEGKKDLVFLHAKSSTNLKIPKLSDRDCN